MPSYIPWQNALIQNALLKKGILNKGILSRDIGGHFWKGKRAFPPNRQKPSCNWHDERKQIEGVDKLNFYLYDEEDDPVPSIESSSY